MCKWHDFLSRIINSWLYVIQVQSVIYVIWESGGRSMVLKICFEWTPSQSIMLFCEIALTQFNLLTNLYSVLCIMYILYKVIEYYVNFRVTLLESSLGS